jgi:hypothetical protein
MKLFCSLLIVLLQLTRLSSGAPPRKGPTHSEHQLEQAASHSSTTPTQPLHELLLQRVARGASIADNAKFRNDFATHPDVSKINLRDSSSDVVINQLLGLRLPNTVEQSSLFNQKLTLAAYGLIKDKIGADSELLKKYKLQTYLLRMKGNTERKRLQNHDEETMLRRRRQQKEYEERLKERKRLQEEEGSLKDLPMETHLGELSKKRRLSAAEVVERATQYRPLYSTLMSFYGATRTYMKQHKYKVKEIDQARLQYRRENELKQNRIYNSMRSKSATRRKASKEGRASEASAPFPTPEEVEQSKKARVSELLSNTDWYKTHHL